MIDQKYNNPSLKRLQSRYDEVEEDFRGIIKNWNQLIRNHLTKTMGVTLSDGDDRFHISIDVRPSMDQSFFQIIERNYPDLDFEEYFLLKQYVDSARKANGYFEDPKAKHDLDLSVEYAEYRLRRFNILDISNDIFKFLTPDNEDVFGCYYLKSSKIEIFVFPIVLFCQLHGLDIESFVVMVLTHELAHGYNHIGRDKDGYYWSSFQQADVYLAEGLAQYYTDNFINKYHFKRHSLLQTFDKTLELQPEPYGCFKDWNTSSPEVVYRAFIEARRNQMNIYKDFVFALDNAKGTIEKSRF